MRLLVCGRLAAAAVSLLACSAAARPVTVDDVLAREAVGRVALGARWAVLELRGPYESGAAFDYDLRNDILRTGLHAVDLRQPAAPRPLFQADGATAKAGYAMGPLSPDGERLAVFRLSDGEWRLGVADIAAAQVTWLDLTPELNPTGETVQWLGDHALVVLTAPEGLLPLDLRLRRYTPLLADRRRINAHGGVSATVLGSGRYLDQTPQDPPGRMVRVDLATGAVRTLAVGRFTDLEISASGRWIAAFSAGPLIPLRSDQPVQGPHGTETRRTRLSLVDARTGAIRPIARDHDMLPQLLRWAPAADELLVLGRADGHPWSAGRLLRVEASTSAVQPLLAVRPHVSGRPAAVRAGWLSGRPVVFGTAASAPQDARPEWFRLERDRAIGLTASLPSPAPSEPSVLTDAALWLPAGDGAWRIGRDDAPRLISAPGARLAIPLVQGLRRRREQFPLEAAEPPPWLARAPDAKLLAAGPHGLVVSRWRPRWGEEIAWRSAAGDVTPLLTLNRGLAEVDPPRVVAVPHAGPGGIPLTSWVLLPPTLAPNSPPPPLVVWPYPGSSFPTFPAYMDVRTGGGLETPALLAGQGFAVLIPSLPDGDQAEGPAPGLAQRVLEIVDTATRQPDLRGAFDPARLGVWGVSFGGYAALAMAGQTDRFSAVVAQAAPANLFSMHGNFGLRRMALPEGGLGVAPSAGWTEDLQADMRAPPWAAVDRYVRNSPVLQADRIRAPVLILHGELDTIPVSEAQQVFSSLFRQGKDAMLVVYWGEEHRIASPGAIRDYHQRAFAFLDENLKPGSAAAGGAPHEPRQARASASVSPRPRPWRRP